MAGGCSVRREGITGGVHRIARALVQAYAALSVVGGRARGCSVRKERPNQGVHRILHEETCFRIEELGEMPDVLQAHSLQVMSLCNSWSPSAATHSRYHVRLRSRATLFEQHGTFFTREMPERLGVPIAVVRRGVFFELRLEKGFCWNVKVKTSSCC